MKTKLVKTLFLLIICVGVFTCGIVKYHTKEELPTRKIEIVEDTFSNIEYLETFEDYTFDINETSTTFVGYKTLDKSLFEELDTVSLDTIPDDGLSVRYEYYYDYVTDDCSMKAITELNGEVVETETIYGKACINQKGEIDAVMEIDGEYFLLSDIKEDKNFENCGWFKKAIKSIAIASALTAVAAAVVVATVFSGGMVGCIVAGAVAGCIAGGVTGAICQSEYSEDKKVTVGGVAASAGVGTVVGAVAGAAVGAGKFAVQQYIKVTKRACDVVAVEETVRNTAEEVNNNPNIASTLSDFGNKVSNVFNNSSSIVNNTSNLTNGTSVAANATSSTGVSLTGKALETYNAVSNAISNKTKGSIDQFFTCDNFTHEQNHIMLAKHTWEKVVGEEKSYELVKTLINKTLLEGTYEPYDKCPDKVLLYSLNYQNEIIDVKVTIEEGILKLSDAWVRSK